jgi:hypothetical protein
VRGSLHPSPNLRPRALRDGKDRLDQAIRSYLRAAGFTASDRLEAFESLETLDAIHRSINVLDPHFSYDFSVISRPPDGWPEPSPVLVASPSPDLVASTAIFDNERAVIFYIQALLNPAEIAKERSLPLRFEVSAEPGTSQFEAWGDFVNYGIDTPEWIPVSNLSITLPGGLGAVETEGGVRMGRSVLGRPEEIWTLAILDNTGNAVLASIDLAGGPPSWGPSGHGWSLTAIDPHQSLRLVLRVDPDQSTYQLTYSAFPGRTLRSVLPAWRMLMAFHAPNLIQVGIAGGAPLTPPSPIQVDEQPAFGQMFEILKLLQTIQEATLTRILVPEPQYFPVQLPEWQRAALLLQGEVLRGSWTSFRFTAGSQGAFSIGDFFAIGTTRPLSVKIGLQEVLVGSIVYEFPAVEVADVELVASNDRRIKVVPHNGADCQLRLVRG